MLIRIRHAWSLCGGGGGGLKKENTLSIDQCNRHLFGYLATYLPYIVLAKLALVPFNVVPHLRKGVVKALLDTPKRQVPMIALEQRTWIILARAGVSEECVFIAKGPSKVEMARICTG